MNNSSHSYNRKLFGMDEFKNDFASVAEIQNGPFGFGSERTLEDYERYAGLCFSKRGVQQYTVDHKEAPNPPVEGSYQEFKDTCVPLFKHCIDVGYDKVPHDDYDFWCVAFKDEKGNEMYRQDVDENEIKQMKNDPDKYCKIWRQFETEIKPSSWIVWPHSKSHGWGDQITGVL